MFNRYINSIALCAMLFIHVLLSGCSKLENECVVESTCLQINANVYEVGSTKMVLNDGQLKTSFQWELGDNFGLFISDLHDNIQFNYRGQDNSFSGEINRLFVKKDDVYCYAYFPYSSYVGSTPSILSGVLNSDQKEPFGWNNDYMISEPVKLNYNEESLQTINVTFSKHLFSLVRVSIINTDARIANGAIISIGLSSKTSYLGGAFSFDVTNPTKDASFSADPLKQYKTVRAVFDAENRPLLGVGVEHTVYLVVRPGEYASGDLSLVVNTSNHTINIQTKKEINLVRNKMASLPLATITSGSTRQGRKKLKIVTYGDSISCGEGTNSFNGYLRLLCGDLADVINAAVSGDGPYQIVGRQGGIPLFSDDKEIELPKKSTEKVAIDGLWVKVENSTSYRNVYTVQTSSWNNRINPVFIDGTECTISYDQASGQRYLSRNTDTTDTKVISARTPISTYASRELADADLLIVYMGTNGKNTGDFNDQLLKKYHDLMLSYCRTTNPQAKMIVLGLHHSMYDKPFYYSSSYAALFSNSYGRFFVDQRYEINRDAVDLLLDVGIINDKSDLDYINKCYIERGDVPPIMLRSRYDEHPSGRGNQIRAIVCYNRMKELGII